MKTKIKLTLLGPALAFGLQPSARLQAATTIDAANKYAYGANLGWVDWRGDINQFAGMERGEHAVLCGADQFVLEHRRLGRFCHPESRRLEQHDRD